MSTKPNIVGPGGQLYADPKPTPDEDAFQVNNTSAAYYSSKYYLLNKNQVQPIPPRRTGALPYLKLTDFIPQDLADAIEASGKITFHVVGDTGAAKVSKNQTAATAIAKEAAVADAMVEDVQSGGINGPAFFSTWEMSFTTSVRRYITTTNSTNPSVNTIAPFSPYPAIMTAWCSARYRPLLRFRR